MVWMKRWECMVAKMVLYLGAIQSGFKLMFALPQLLRGWIDR